jgi:hypothetical protein
MRRKLTHVLPICVLLVSVVRATPSTAADIIDPGIDYPGIDRAPGVSNEKPRSARAPAPVATPESSTTSAYSRKMSGVDVTEPEIVDPGKDRSLAANMVRDNHISNITDPGRDTSSLEIKINEKDVVDPGKDKSMATAPLTSDVTRTADGVQIIINVGGGVSSPASARVSATPYMPAATLSTRPAASFKSLNTGLTDCHIPFDELAAKSPDCTGQPLTDGQGAVAGVVEIGKRRNLQFVKANQNRR